MELAGVEPVSEFFKVINKYELNLYKNTRGSFTAPFVSRRWQVVVFAQCFRRTLSNKIRSA